MSERDTIIIRVPSRLKKDLQILAIENESNMNEIIVPLIADYVNQHK